MSLPTFGSTVRAPSMCVRHFGDTFSVSDLTYSKTNIEKSKKFICLYGWTERSFVRALVWVYGKCWWRLYHSRLHRPRWWIPYALSFTPLSLNTHHFCCLHTNTVCIHVTECTTLLLTQKPKKNEKKKKYFLKWRYHVAFKLTVCSENSEKSRIFLRTFCFICLNWWCGKFCPTKFQPIE